MRVAVVGCGYWGKNLVRTFSELQALAALCDAHTETAQTLSQQYCVPVLSLEAILSDPTLDGVVIAAPAVFHAPLIQQALLADKHVFVEKPLALSVADGQALANLARAQNKLLMIGHLLQYHTAFLALKDLVEAGKLGALQYIYSHRLNLGKIRTEENVLWSFAPHDFSMILGLAKDLPEKIWATGTASLNPALADTATAHLFFRDGLKAHVFVSWLHPEKEQKLVVVGDKGMAVFNDRLPWAEKLQLYPAPIQWENGLPSVKKGDPVCLPCEPLEPLKKECRHFLRCMEKNEPPRTDGPEGLRVLQVLQAAEQSMQTSQIIAIPPAQPYFFHETAYIDAGCTIGEGSKIWHFSHILKGSTLGKNVIVGQNTMIGPDVTVGDFCKIQNNVTLYKGVILEEGVFCGPSCVFTNVFTPRAQIERKDEFLPTYVEKGVTIGANATIVCGIRLGAYCLIGAGAVVIRNVKPHALMVGNPARQIGWVSHAGEKLGEDLVCKRERRRYYLDEEGFLQEKY